MLGFTHIPEKGQNYDQLSGTLVSSGGDGDSLLRREEERKLNDYPELQVFVYMYTIEYITCLYVVVYVCVCVCFYVCNVLLCLSHTYDSLY